MISLSASSACLCLGIFFTFISSSVLCSTILYFLFRMFFLILLFTNCSMYFTAFSTLFCRVCLFFHFSLSAALFCSLRPLLFSFSLVLSATFFVRSVPRPFVTPSRPLQAKNGQPQEDPQRQRRLPWDGVALCLAVEPRLAS